MNETTEPTPPKPTPTKRSMTLEPGEVDRFLMRLDRMAQLVIDNQEDFTVAKNLVNTIDKLADDLETATYGEESLRVRKRSFQNMTVVKAPTN